METANPDTERPIEDATRPHDAADPAACCLGGRPTDTDPKSAMQACFEKVGGDGDTNSGCTMSGMFGALGSKVKPGLAFLLLIPALVLLGLGALIVLEPIVLVWLAAGILVLVGLVLLRLTFKIRRFLASLREAATA